MIRGMYLTSMDEIDHVLDLRERVFFTGRDSFDRMAMYALALDHEGCPAGAGRLFIDESDQFRLDTLGVLENRRGQGLGDLMVRMLLQRALDLNAPRIVLSAPDALIPFFKKYGFEPTGAGAMEATPQSIERMGGCGGHCTG